MQRGRRRLDLRCSPDEDDVEDGEQNHGGRERLRRRDARRQLGDGRAGERDERDRCGLRDEPVREPRDEPDSERERCAQCREQRRRDGAEPREEMWAVGDDAEDRDAATEGRRRHERCASRQRGASRPGAHAR
jgi:hypothetical protein